MDTANTPPRDHPYWRLSLDISKLRQAEAIVQQIAAFQPLVKITEVADSNGAARACFLILVPAGRKPVPLKTQLERTHPQLRGKWEFVTLNGDGFITKVEQKTVPR